VLWLAGIAFTGQGRGLSLALAKSNQARNVRAGRKKELLSRHLLFALSRTDVRGKTWESSRQQTHFPPMHALITMRPLLLRVAHSRGVKSSSQRPPFAPVLSYATGSANREWTISTEDDRPSVVIGCYRSLSRAINWCWKTLRLPSGLAQSLAPLPRDLARSRSAIGILTSSSSSKDDRAGSIAPGIYSRLSPIARWCALPLLSFDQPSQRKWDHGFCPRLLINLELYPREGSHQARIARHFLNKRPDRMNPRD